MTKKQIIVLGAVIVIVLTAFASARLDKQPTEPEEIKIGHISPLTGDAAMYGEWETQGIELAVEEINNRSGINGIEIKVIHEDTQADPKTGTSALTKLITVDKVPVVVGAAASSVTLAVAPIAEKNEVVLISAVSAAIKISDAGDYIFRVFPSNAAEGEKLLELAKELKLQNGTILYISNDFGTELAKVVDAEFTKAGGTILLSEGYEQGATDFRTQLTKVQAENPEAIFLLGYPKDMALICKQAREMGIKAQFLAPDTFNSPEILEWGGNATEGVIFVFPAEGVTGEWESFSKKIETKYGKEPNIATAMAYDAMNLIAIAMERGGTTGEAIKNELYKITDYPGVTGNITFDANGDVVYRPMAVRIVKGGEFIEY